jgi:hypothetical protein
MGLARGAYKGETVLLTRHCFVPSSGYTWMYTPGLHETWTVQCDVFTACRKIQTGVSRSAAALSGIGLTPSITTPFNQRLDD